MKDITDAEILEEIQKYLGDEPVSNIPNAFTTVQAQKVLGYGKTKTLRILHAMADRGKLRALKFMREDRWGDSQARKGWQLLNGERPE